MSINISIRVSNVRRIEDALLKAFGTIHLFDEEIKMRIRYSIIILSHAYPRLFIKICS
jgi:hypothetical protein